MENNDVEPDNTQAPVQPPPEKNEVKQGQGEINAIKDVTDYPEFENIKIKNIINNEINNYDRPARIDESAHVDFVLFKKSAGSERVPDFLDESVRQFLQSRLMVISYAYRLDELALAAAEKVVFEQEIEHDFKPLCCSLQHHHTLNLSQFIRSAADHKNFNAEREQMIIVFEQRPEETASTFIANIAKKGGASNIISDSLESYKLHIVYVCQCNRLFESEQASQRHFGLYLIDPYIKAFYDVKKDTGLAMSLYSVAWDTIRKTGWLNELTEEQKIAHLTRLIRSDKLEEEAAQQLKSIDYVKETEVAGELLAEPLKNIVLFAQTFFEGISLSEYDGLVRQLLSSISSEQGPGGKNDAVSALLWNWNSNGDAILSACGIYLDDSMDKKVSSYKFLMEIKETIIRKALKNNYRMALARRHESIGELLVENPLAFSGTFIDAWFRLFFETATLDPHRYLLRFGLRVAELIIDEDDNIYDSAEKKRLLIMLINFIGTWEDHESLNPVIARFYEEMKKTSDRRALLGTIFSFHCTPERPQMLKRLKIHLESISKDEILFNLDVINSISFNYLGNIPSLLEVIMDWNEAETGNPLRSASHVRCAYLLLFYRQWPFQCRKGDLSYRILKQLVTNELGLKRLTAFIFGNGIAEAFKLLHVDKYRQKYDTEPLLKRTMISHLHLMQAFVLIQWYYLFNLIRSDMPNAEWEPQQVFAICTNEIITTTGPGTLKSAIGRAATLLNYEIEEKMAEPEKKNLVQILKRKRDDARELLTLI